jgi:hypothetical protein
MEHPLAQQPAPPSFKRPTPAARRVYQAPRLTVHGTLAALTASTAADGLVLSRLTGG